MEAVINIKNGSTYDLRMPADEAYAAFPLLRHTADSDKFNTIRLMPPAVLLEVEDFAFHHNSAVPLPCLPTEDDHGEMPVGTDPSIMKEVESYHPDAYQRFHSESWDDDIGDNESQWLRIMTVLLAVAYEFCEKNPTYHLVLAGHCDTSGTDTINFPLSDMRAEAIYCLLMGERKRWVEIVQNRSKVEDFQRICNHYSDRYAWPCHVGAVDNLGGPRTRDGLKGLQGSYNEAFKQSIKTDGLIGPETWGAIFDCYMDELGRLMDVDVDQLASYRKNIRFVDGNHPWVGCGERVPIDEPDRNNYRSLKNRRVEMLFFDEINKPSLQDHIDDGVMRTSTSKRNDSSIYGSGAYRWVAIVPQWWEASPPSVDYSPKFEILDFEGNAEERIDEPDSADYEIEADEVMLDDESDPFAAFHFYGQNDFGLNDLGLRRKKL